MSASIYDEIASEVSQGDIDRGLWMQAYALSDGDEERARAQYIKLRVRKLQRPGFRMRRIAAKSARPATGRGRTSALFGWWREWCADFAASLWTSWLWAWTLVFAALTAVGVLCLVVMFYLRLWDDGVVVWPFFTAGCGFLTCFLFGRGVQSFAHRRPTIFFYGLELIAVCAAVVGISRLTNPVFLGLVPHAFSSELVFVAVRFFGAGSSGCSVLAVALFFLPVYGVVVFLRQRKI